MHSFRGQYFSSVCSPDFFKFPSNNVKRYVTKGIAKVMIPFIWLRLSYIRILFLALFLGCAPSWFFLSIWHVVSYLLHELLDICIYRLSLILQRWCLDQFGCFRGGESLFYVGSFGTFEVRTHQAFRDHRQKFMSFEPARYSGYLSKTRWRQWLVRERIPRWNIGIYTCFPVFLCSVIILCSVITITKGMYFSPTRD